MKQPWQVFRKAVPDAKRYIDYGEGLVSLDTTDDDTEYRLAQGVGFTSQHLRDLLTPHVNQAAQRLGIEWGGRFTHHDLIRYGPGGRYDWHVDNDLVNFPNRKLTCVLALNEGYEGGGLEIAWPNPCAIHHFHLDMGDLIVFPSLLLHRGVEVAAGERWIVVTWALGRRFN